jgi:hypothetical protein
MYWRRRQPRPKVHRIWLRVDTEKAHREKYPNALKVIKYDKAAAEQFDRLSKLPEEFSKKFLEAVEVDTRCNTESLANELLEEHRKQIGPYEDEKLNVALAEMREISSEAEQEFGKAVVAIGEDGINTEFVCDQIRANTLPLKRIALPNLLTEKIEKVADATELLETLGYEIRRSGSVVFGYKFHILMYGKSLGKELLAYKVVDLANQKLREIINAD